MNISNCFPLFILLFLIWLLKLWSSTRRYTSLLFEQGKKRKQPKLNLLYAVNKTKVEFIVYVIFTDELFQCSIPPTLYGHLLQLYPVKIKSCFFFFKNPVSDTFQFILCLLRLRVYPLFSECKNTQSPSITISLNYSQTLYTSEQVLHVVNTVFIFMLCIWRHDGKREIFKRFLRDLYFWLVLW